MYCANCSESIEKGSKFCHNCGIGINSSSLMAKPAERLEKQFVSRKNPASAQAEPAGMTVDDYLAQTNIRSREEAKAMLTRLKLLFWIFGISIFVMNFLTELGSLFGTEAFYLLFIPYFLLLAYFIYYCSKVLKSINESRSNAVWCVVFAPLSWFYLYHLMTKPLKIITGVLPLPSKEDELAKIRRQKTSIKKFWLRFWTVTAILIVLFLLVLGMMVSV